MPLTELQKKLLGGFKATAIPGYVPIQPGGSPLEYAQLHDLPMDTTLWNNSMIREYTSWAKSQIPDPGAASFGPYEPPPLPQVAVGEDVGFGPGSYAGGYTGQGDTIYWGKHGEGAESNWSGQSEVESILADSISDVTSLSQATTGYSETTMPAVSDVTSQQTDMSTPFSQQNRRYGREAGFAEAFEGQSVAGRGAMSSIGSKSSGDTMSAMSSIGSKSTESPMFGRFTRGADDIMSQATSMVSGESSYSSVGTSTVARFADNEFGSPPDVWVGKGSQFDLSNVPDVNELPPGLFDNLNIDQLDRVSVAFSESSVGVGADGMGLFSMNALYSNLIGLAIGAALQPFISWLNTLGVGGQVVSQTIAMGGVAAAIFSDNPIGAIAYGGAYLTELYLKQMDRVNANNWEENVDNTRFGYVQEAGIWYPAVIRRRHRDSGLASDMNEVTFSYGKADEFFLALDGAGEVGAHFVNGKTREFQMTDDEYSKDYSYDYMDNHNDFMRQWYMMTPEETKDVFSKLGDSDFSFTEHDQDTSDYTPFMKLNSDFIRGIDLVKSNVKSLDPSENVIPAGRLFRSSYNDMLSDNKRAFEGQNVRTGYRTGMPGPDDDLGRGTWWDSRKWAGKQSYKPVNDILHVYLPRQLGALTAVRKIAAEEQGIPWTIYTDDAKDLPVALTAEELTAQYATIKGYTDRTSAQKDYLLQKAASRWMMKVSSDFGFGDKFYTEWHEHVETRDKNEKQTGDTYMNQLPSEYLSGSEMDDYNKNHDVRAGTVEQLPDWMNRGEAGIPDWFDISDSYRQEEDKGKLMFADYWSTSVRDFGEFPSNILLESGKKTQEGVDYKKKSPEEQREMAKIKKGQIIADYHPTRTEPSRKYGVRKPFWGRAKKFIYKGKTYEDFITEGQQLKKERGFIPKQAGHYQDFLKIYGKSFAGGEVSTIYERGFFSERYTGEVTYEKVKSWFANSSVAPEVELGEPSLVHFYEKFLKGEYSWAPSDTTITEDILPPGYLEGIESHFKPLLAEIGDDPQLRQRADVLHNAVHKPSTQEYLDRYHHTDNVQLAKDAAGTSELFADWSESYEGKMNKVRFNNQLHQQIDFGVGETV